MTNDFTEQFNPEDLKRFIGVMRYHYRSVYSINESLRYDIRSLEKKLEMSVKEKELAEKKEANAKIAITEMKNKKLTLKERLLGKLNIKINI
jgi:hypothetical protein